MLKSLGRRHAEATTSAAPCEAFYTEPGQVDMDEMERIDLAPAPCARGRACLNQKGRVAIAVAHRALPHMCDVQVTGQDKVHPAATERRHSDRCARNHVSFMSRLRRVERMVGNDNPGDMRATRVKPRATLLDLTPVYAAVLECERPRSVHAQDRDLLIRVKWLQIVMEVAAVCPEWHQASGDEIVERYIVIARNNQSWKRKAVQELPGGLEFSAASTLRQIAGNHDHVRLGSHDRDM